MTRTRKLGNVFCFIDDLNAINDAGMFESNFGDIYPEELKLCRENGNNAEVNVEVNNANFKTGIFDKRDSFPFSMVKMPEKFSNIP